MKNIKKGNNSSKLPLISVLIPVYNSEKFLDKCLSSTISQSYKNIEIICIDDCSNDTSLDVLKKYKIKDNRIKIMKHKINMGENKTRKQLIDELKGDYFIFIDSDDYVEKHLIKKMYEIIIKDKSDLVECNVNIIKKGQRKTDFSVKNFGIFQTQQYIYKYKAVLWNKLFKTSIVKKNKINFPSDDNITCGFDKFFNFEYICTIKKISVIPDKLYNYVIHDSSTLSTMKDHQILSDFYSLNKCYDFLQKNRIFIKYSNVFFKLLNKFQSKLVKNDTFFKNAIKEINTLYKKLYSDHRYIFSVYKIKYIIHNLLSIQSSLDGRYKIINFLNYKIKIVKRRN